MGLLMVTPWVEEPGQRLGRVLYAVLGHHPPIRH